MNPYYETELGKLYHSDCLEIMPELEPVDLVLTDPPYGITQNRWDKIETTIIAFDLLMPCNLVFTCRNPASAELITRYRKYFKWSDVWHKSQATGFLNAKIMPLREHEDILVFSNGRMTYNPQIKKKELCNIRKPTDSGRSTNYGKFNPKIHGNAIAIDETYPRSVIKFNNSQEGIHPNEKPIKLVQYLIATYSNKKNVILDPFGGSLFPFAIACERLNRRWIGIEISEEYCEVAAKRIEKETRQLKLWN